MQLSKGKKPITGIIILTCQFFRENNNNKEMLQVAYSKSSNLYTQHTHTHTLYYSFTLKQRLILKKIKITKKIENLSFMSIQDYKFTCSCAKMKTNNNQQQEKRIQKNFN